MSWVNRGPMVVKPRGQGCSRTEPVTVKTPPSATLGGDASKRPSGVDFWKQGGQTRDELRAFLAAPRNTQVTPYSGVFDRDLSFDYPPLTP